MLFLEMLGHIIERAVQIAGGLPGADGFDKCLGQEIRAAVGHAVGQRHTGFHVAENLFEPAL